MRTIEFFAGGRRARLLAAACVLALTGCVDSGGSSGTPELVWGVQGIDKGELQKPRAIAIDAKDQIYLVDMTGRIQVYDADGNYLRGWRTPVSVNGRPTGLTMAKSGRLLVPDTHYYRVLTYEPDGTPVKEATLGGVMGPAPGEFGWVTDVAEDSKGNLYVSEYGDTDRIQKFSPEGNFSYNGAAAAKSWGSSAGRKVWRSTSRIACGSPTLAITASKSSVPRASCWITGGRKARSRGSCITLMASCSTARGMCTCASTATIACRSLRWRGSRLGRGGSKAESRDN